MNYYVNYAILFSCVSEGTAQILNDTRHLNCLMSLSMEIGTLGGPMPYLSALKHARIVNYGFFIGPYK